MSKWRKTFENLLKNISVEHLDLPFVEQMLKVKDDKKLSLSKYLFLLRIYCFIQKKYEKDKALSEVIREYIDSELDFQKEITNSIKKELK